MCRDTNQGRFQGGSTVSQNQWNLITSTVDTGTAKQKALFVPCVPTSDRNLPHQSVTTHGAVYQLLPRHPCQSFRFIEYLKNQFLEMDGLSNVVIFLCYLETRNSVLDSLVAPPI
jgi:hypothetical protein